MSEMLKYKNSGFDALKSLNGFLTIFDGLDETTIAKRYGLFYVLLVRNSRAAIAKATQS